MGNNKKKTHINILCLQRLQFHQLANLLLTSFKIDGYDLYPQFRILQILQPSQLFWEAQGTRIPVSGSNTYINPSSFSTKTNILNENFRCPRDITLSNRHSD